MRTKDQGADGGRRAIRSGGGWRGLDGGVRSGWDARNSRSMAAHCLGGRWGMASGSRPSCLTSQRARRSKGAGPKPCALRRMRKSTAEGEARSAAFEGDELSEIEREFRGERVEGKRFRDVEAGGFGGVDVDERRESRDRLFDFGPAESALVAVVVRGIDAFRDTLDAGDGFDGAAILCGDAGSDNAGEGAVIAFDAHDAGSGDAQIRSAEVTNADEIGGDESVFQRDKDIQSGLRVGEHALRVEEGSEGRGRSGHRLLERVMGHFFLKSGAQVALIVAGEAAEEGRVVDDVGVGGDGESFGDFRGDEDFAVLGAEIVGVVFGFAAKGAGAGRFARGEIKQAGKSECAGGSREVIRGRRGNG